MPLADARGSVLWLFARNRDREEAAEKLYPAVRDLVTPGSAIEGDGPLRGEARWLDTIMGYLLNGFVHLQYLWRVQPIRKACH